MHLYLLFTSGNCNDIRLQNQTALSGEYNITLDSGQVVPVYCEFMVKQGYTFIPKSTLPSLTTLEGLYDISDHAIIRILYGNGEQHEVEVAQLSMFRDRFPLSIQLSSQIGYKRPYNWIMKPYLYLGFMPRNYTILKSKMTRSKPFQGYWAGQGNVIFKNFCKRPDSYIAFFGNDGNVTEHTYSKT